MTFTLIMAEVHRLIPYIGIALYSLLIIRGGIGIGRRIERRRIMDRIPEEARALISEARADAEHAAAERDRERETVRALAAGLRAVSTLASEPVEARGGIRRVK
jgi:hypothetical protein